jgi:hypothetical protein
MYIYMYKHTCIPYHAYIYVYIYIYKHTCILYHSFIYIYIYVYKHTISFIALALGPMKAIPDDSHRSTNLAFSDKNPYPGWIACAPEAKATYMYTCIICKCEWCVNIIYMHMNVYEHGNIYIYRFLVACIYMYIKSVFRVNCLCTRS